MFQQSSSKESFDWHNYKTADLLAKNLLRTWTILLLQNIYQSFLWKQSNGGRFWVWVKMSWFGNQELSILIES